MVPCHIARPRGTGSNPYQVVIMDEFRETQMPFEMLLSYLSTDPMSVQVKGSSIPFNSDIIIITTDRDPRLLYSQSGNIQQLIRRCSMVVRFGEPKGLALTTCMDPAYKISGELEDRSWFCLDSEGSVVGGTAQTYVPPVPATLPTMPDSDIFADLFPEMSDSDGLSLPEFWPNEEKENQSLNPYAPGVHQTKPIKPGDKLIFNYRILKCDVEKCLQFGISF